MKAAISGETLGSVMELDEILSLFQKNGIHFIEIWPENIPVKVGKTLLHKRLYANRDVEQAKKILEKYQIKAACVCFGAGFDKEFAKDPELFSAFLRLFMQGRGTRSKERSTKENHSHETNAFPHSHPHDAAVSRRLRQQGRRADRRWQRAFAGAGRRRGAVRRNDRDARRAGAARADAAGRAGAGGQQAGADAAG